MVNLTLKPWHKSIAKDTGSICICVKDGVYSESSSPSGDFFSGWYASYNEGVFAFFENEPGSLCIGWNGKSVEVEQISAAIWTSKIRGRRFECFDLRGDCLLKFSYRSFLRFLVNPFRLFDEMFAPDDDWALVADLPGFIHSCVEDKNIIEQFNLLRERELTETTKL